MIPSTNYLVTLLAVAKLAAFATAQSIPLVSRTFAYDDIPYQVSGQDAGPRGPQSGYNICNSTTEGQNAMCQTLILNSIDDFCMWSSNLNTGTDVIGDGEARLVAWCTKKGHGSRLIPSGAITGIQWLYAKNYLQVVGYIDQTKIGLRSDDFGGELDPHGADAQGNPLGGLAYSNGFGTNAQSYKVNETKSDDQYKQVIEWVDFQGSNLFCLKMCNPTYKDAPKLCNHIYDRIGCTYNAAADYSKINGTFEVCDSEDMTPPGVYVENGATMTWTQGPEGVPVDPPYTPTAPASSNCRTFSSAELFGAAATTASGSQTTGTATGTRSGSNPTNPTPGGSGSGASPTQSGAALPLVGAPSSAIMAVTFGLLSLFA